MSDHAIHGLLAPIPDILWGIPGVPCGQKTVHEDRPGGSGRQPLSSLPACDDTARRSSIVRRPPQGARFCGLPLAFSTSDGAGSTSLKCAPAKGVTAAIAEPTSAQPAARLVLAVPDASQRQPGRHAG